MKYHMTACQQLLDIITYCPIGVKKKPMFTNWSFYQCHVVSISDCITVIPPCKKERVSGMHFSTTDLYSKQI